VHRPEQTLEITQQTAFDIAQALRILPHRLHLVERPFPVALVDGLTQRRWATEVAVGQELNLADADFGAGDRLHKPLNLRGTRAVHAHKRPQGEHVRVDRQLAAKQNPLDRGSHLLEQIAACADPGLAPREQLGHVGDRHLMHAQQFVHESSLLENRERPLPAGTQQAGNAFRRVLAA